MCGVHFLAVMAFIGLHKWEEARFSAEGGIALNPSGTVRVGLYLAIADIGMHQKNYDAAAANYLRASEMFINDEEIKPLGLFRAAKALEKGGNAEEANRIRKHFFAFDDIRKIQPCTACALSKTVREVCLDCTITSGHPQ